MGLAACGGSQSTTAASGGAAAGSELSGELVFTIWDNNLM